MINLSTELDYSNLLDIIKLSKSGEFPNTHITFVNPYSYYRIPAQKHFNYIFPDGGSLCILHNIFSNRKVKRYSFDLSSLGKDVLLIANSRKLKVALIGGTESEIKKTSRNIKGMYNDIDLCYTRNGFFKGEQEEKKIIKEIQNCNPDITLVSMGTPLQEEIQIKLKKNKAGGISFTCGGFISQTSRKPDYYHPLIKTTKTYWLQRALQEKHVRRRLITDYPIFFIKYILELIKTK